MEIILEQIYLLQRRFGNPVDMVNEHLVVLLDSL